MRLLTLTIMVLVALSLAGCDKLGLGKQSSPFPGYDQVSTNGDGKRFYVQTSQIKFILGGDAPVASADIAEQYADGTYGIYTMSVSCIMHTVYRASGQKYQKDGSAVGSIPEAPASDIAAQPAYKPATDFVCARVHDARRITGNYSDAGALKLLYYAQNPKTTSDRTPADFSWAGSRAKTFTGPYASGKTLVKIETVFDYAEAGIPKKALYLSFLPNQVDPYTCHACAPLVAVAIFKKAGDGWEVERDGVPFVELGAYGEPPTPAWVLTGTDHYALVMTETDGGQGEFNTLIDLVDVDANRRLQYPLHITFPVDKATISFTPGANPEHYDAHIDFSGALVSPGAAAPHPMLLTYQGTKYVVVKQADAAPQVQQPATQEAATNPEPGLTAPASPSATQAPPLVARPPVTRAPVAADNGMSQIIGQMLSDGDACFAKKQYGCSITNATNVLRMQPGNGRAQVLKTKSEQAQAAAMDSIEIK